MNESLRYTAMGLAVLGLLLLVVIQFVPFARVEAAQGTTFVATEYTPWGQDGPGGRSTWLSQTGLAGGEWLQSAGFVLLVASLLAAAAGILLLVGRIGIGAGLGILGGASVAAFFVLMYVGLSTLADRQFGQEIALGSGAALSFVAFASILGGGIVAALPATREAANPRKRGPILSVATPKAFDPLASMDDPKRFQPDPPKDYKPFDVVVGPKTFDVGSEDSKEEAQGTPPPEAMGKAGPAKPASTTPPVTRPATPKPEGTASTAPAKPATPGAKGTTAKPTPPPAAKKNDATK